jgi:hypothetical protein
VMRREGLFFPFWCELSSQKGTVIHAGGYVGDVTKGN